MSGFKCRKVGKSAGELYLYDEIGESWGIGISAGRVIEELKALGQIETLQVRINSPGGDVFDGLAIYNALARHPAKVETHIDGMALSIASVIAMAGKEIVMASNAMMMIHDPWTIAMGSAEDFRAKAVLMDQVKGNLVDTYVRRTGLDADKVSALMSDETWFTAEDAKHLGFVDSLAEDLQVAAKFDLSRFRHPPKNMNRGDGQSVGRSIYRAKLADQERRAQSFGISPK